MARSTPSIKINSVAITSRLADLQNIIDSWVRLEVAARLTHQHGPRRSLRIPGCRERLLGFIPQLLALGKLLDQPQWRSRLQAMNQHPPEKQRAIDVLRAAMTGDQRLVRTLVTRDDFRDATKAQSPCGWLFDLRDELLCIELATHEELPKGKDRRVISLYQLQVTIADPMPHSQERLRTWPELAALERHCNRLRPQYQWGAPVVAALMTWFQTDGGLTPEQAKYLPLAEAVRRLDEHERRPHESAETRAPIDGSAVELLMGEEAQAILKIATSDKSADDRMMEIYRTDLRAIAWKSPHWATILGITDSAVRKTYFWKEFRNSKRAG